MARGQVVINIVGDVSDLQSKLKSGAGSLDAFGNEAARSGDRLTGVGSKLTLGLTGPLVAGLGMAAKAAADEGKEMALLANTLQNTTGANDEQIASVEEWITATQNATGVSDGSLRPALQRLLEAGRSVEQSQSDMAVALDIAAAKGLDVEAVSGAMAKAALGNVGALGRLGIATKDASGATLTYDEVLKNAAATMGGAAAKAADTTAGKAAITQAKMADLAETIGTSVVPVMEQVVGVGARIADGFAGLPGPVQTGVVALAGVAAASGPILTVVGNVQKLSSAAKTVELSSLAMKGGFLGAIAAIAAVGVVAATTAESLDSKVGGILDDLAQKAGEDLVDGFIKGGESLDIFEEIAKRNLATAFQLRDALDRQGKSVEGMQPILDRYTEKQARAEASTKDAAEAVQEETGALDEQTEATDEAVDALEAYSTAMDEAFGVTLSVRDAHRETRAAVDELAAAIKDGQSEDETAIQFKDRLADSLDNVVESIADEVDAMAESGEIADTAAARTGALRERLQALKGQYPALAGEIDVFINAATEAANRSGAEGTRLASEWIRGATAGFRNGAGQVVASADTVARQVTQTFATRWKVQSPSKVAEKLGTNFDDGLAKGLKGGKSPAAAAMLAQHVIDSVEGVVGAVGAVGGRRGARNDLRGAREALRDVEREREGLPAERAKAEAELAAAKAEAARVTSEERLAVVEATIRLKDAEANLAEVNKDAAASALDKERATLQVAEAQADLAEAQADSVGPTRRVEEATRSLAEVNARSETILERVRDARDDLTEAQLRAVAAEQALREAGEEMIGLGPGAVDNFRRMAEAAGLTRAEIDALVASLGNLNVAQGGTGAAGSAVPAGTRRATREQVANIGKFVGEDWSPGKVDRILQQINEDGTRTLESVAGDVARRVAPTINLTVNQQPGEKMDEKKLVDLLVKTQRKYGPLPISVRR